MIAATPSGSGLISPDSLVERMNWQLPSIIRPEDPAIGAVWAEAHLLGVLAQGALTPIGARWSRPIPRSWWLWPATTCLPQQVSDGSGRT